MKTLKLCLVLLVCCLVFSGCATMFRTNQVSVRAASGANTNVQVMEDGVLIFSGTLPAQFPVRGWHTYTVHFTLENGEKRVVTIGQSFNGWFIGSILLGVFPAIIDLITGSIMTYDNMTILPISHSPMIILGENIPLDENLRIIGNFLSEEIIEVNNSNMSI